MYCFKDMTFCPKEANCGNVECPRNYVHCKDAGDIPVCYFVNCPVDCVDYIKVVEEENKDVQSMA